MDYDQLAHDTPRYPNSQPASEGSDFHNVYSTESYPRPVQEQTVQGQTSNRPTTNHQERHPPGVWSKLDTYSTGVGENRYVSHYSCGSISQSLLCTDASCVRDLRCSASLHQRLIYTHTISRPRHTTRVVCSAAARILVIVSGKCAVGELAPVKGHSAP